MPAKIKRDSEKKTRRYKKSPTNRSKTQSSPSDSPDDDASFSDSEESQYPDEEDPEAHSQEDSPSQEDYASDDDSSCSVKYKQKIQLRFIREHLNLWEQQRRKHPQKRNRRSKQKRECSKNRRKLKRFRIPSKTKRRPRKAPPDESPSTQNVHLTRKPVNHPDSQTAEPLPDLEVPSPTAPTTYPPPTAWTLLARLPAEHPNLVPYIVGRLSQHKEVTEVTEEETIGGPQPQTTIRIKGSTHALYDTQADLEKSGYHEVTLEKDPLSPPSASYPNHWQTTHWETPRTHSPHSRTPDSSSKAKTAEEQAKPKSQQDGREKTLKPPLMTGVIKAIRDNQRFGFIKTDKDEDIFVMPSACIGFGNKIPPVGTRVAFSVMLDDKSRKDKAVHVGPEITEQGRTPGKTVNHSAVKPVGA